MQVKSVHSKETGLQWLEVVVRYLASALEEEELSWEQIKDIAEQAISKETGGYVMTLEEKVKNEGKLEGLVEGEQKGEIKGLKETIELGICPSYLFVLPEIIDKSPTINFTELKFQSCPTTQKI